MNLIRRWLSESISIALALLFAVLAMQAPAFTREYAAALLQVAQDARRDIEQRKASARQFYGIKAAGDEEFVVALQSFEPSNAETLALSLQRTQALQGAYDRIAGAAPLLRPVVAARDAFEDEEGYKETILRRLVDAVERPRDADPPSPSARRARRRRRWRRRPHAAPDDPAGRRTVAARSTSRGRSRNRRSRKRCPCRRLPRRGGSARRATVR